jgi:dienelactone hydrolase
MLRRLPLFLSAAAALLLLLIAPVRAERIGVVLMHGKQGGQAGNIAKLAERLAAAGYLVERPVLCWSRDRIYDKAFPDCLTEIDAAVGQLKARGAERIVVAGQSLGGSAALAYGAQRDGIAGIVAIVPAPPPSVAQRPEIARELERAKRLIASSKADERIRFADVNQGPISVEATPRIYVSFLDPEGPANLVTNTGKLRAPLLWLAADQDRSPFTRDTGFGKAPQHPLNRYVTLHAGHFNAPDAAPGPLLDWLAELGKAR